jgi:transcriptional regulator with XRE-family HTH domain
MISSARPARPAYIETFRAEFTALRLAKDWTQDEPAAMSGYTQAFLSRIEKGSQTPSVTALLNIIDALEKSPDLLEGRLIRAPKSGHGLTEPHKHSTYR